MKKKMIGVGFLATILGTFMLTSNAMSNRSVNQQKSYDKAQQELEEGMNKESADYANYQKYLNIWAESKEALGDKNRTEKTEFCVLYNVKKLDGEQLSAEGKQRGEKECDPVFPKEQ